MKRIGLLLFVLITFQLGFAQLGGGRTYSFLSMPSAARSSALGGDFIAVRDGDVNLVLDNPALLGEETTKSMAFSYVDHLSSVKSGYLVYANQFDDHTFYSFGVQFMGYGSFEETDEFGNVLGEFNSGEYAFDFTYTKELNRLFTAGLSSKLIFSNIASYSSIGLAFDVGFHYMSEAELFQAGLTVNNVGTQITTYTNNTREKLPFEIQLAAAYKLPKAPIRFYLLASNLQQWDLSYPTSLNNAPSISPDGSLQTTEGTAGFGDNLFRHTVIGAELLMSEKFKLRLAYNHQRAKEMQLIAGSGLSGFSFGLGMKIKKFYFDYAVSTYFTGKASNTFTLSTNLSTWKKN